MRADREIIVGDMESWAGYYLSLAGDRHEAATAAMYEAGCWEIMADLARTLAAEAEEPVQVAAVRSVAAQAEAVAP